MNSSRRIVPAVVILLVVGAAGLSRFGANVRTVDAVGLSGAGFALGVAFALLVPRFFGRAPS